MTQKTTQEIGTQSDHDFYPEEKNKGRRDYCGGCADVLLALALIATLLGFAEKGCAGDKKNDSAPKEPTKVSAPANGPTTTLPQVKTR